MRGFDRKSQFEKVLEAADDAVHRLGSGWSKGRVLKASLVAGGLAALTAGSAGVSALRRRDQSGRDGS
jgi:hypothetical protein